jgi:serine/threonine protein kinase
MSDTIDFRSNRTPSLPEEFSLAAQQNFRMIYDVDGVTEISYGSAERTWCSSPENLSVSKNKKRMNPSFDEEDDFSSNCQKQNVSTKFFSFFNDPKMEKIIGSVGTEPSPAASDADPVSYETPGDDPLLIKRQKTEEMKTIEIPMFNSNRPVLPPNYSNLKWMDVLNGNNELIPRLLLPSACKSKAYDLDLGFKMNVRILELQEIRGQIQYVNRCKFMHLYAMRRRTQFTSEGEVAGYSNPPFYPFDPLPNVVFHACEGDPNYWYGMPSKKNVPITLKRISGITIYHERTNTNGAMSLYPDDEVRDIMVAQIGKALLAFDFVNPMKSNIFGETLIAKSYGEVYRGKELSLSSEFPNQKVFSLEEKQDIVIKTVTFDEPLDAYHLPQEINSLKIQFQKTCIYENVINELEAMVFLQKNCCENDESSLVHLRDYVVDYFNIYVVLDYYQGSNVLDYIQTKTKHRRLEEPDARHVFAETLKSLSLFNKFGMSHGDISPENIVIDAPLEDSAMELDDDNGHCPVSDDLTTKPCVLIDYGQVVGQNFHPELQMFEKLPPRDRMSGKKVFRCPELLTMNGCAHCKGDQPYCPQKVDIWQLGILLIILLTGAAPFTPERNYDENVAFFQWMKFIEKRSIRGMYVPWRTDENPQPMRKTELGQTDLSEEVIDLLEWLLSFNPDERPTVEEIMDHDWFRLDF